ncbi:AraC family transcriptional regulator [Pseudomonas plecoglossicida]|uniref:helix-turn-helix transcriptional regulator n=1 Tax=Pseudomonas plecoglossicida TaxID=70775 RepID=UPI00034332CE|nr:AraC family transcriptional regulator [Pseudomonas plecoglossicida]EPB95355.1 AraC family transcriptional regulator [Pseudomonas plecoglossicida NB2011]QLB55122.1 AraC family transcriptional regulator [Pseudomonas plecoglossicida]
MLADIQLLQRFPLLDCHDVAQMQVQLARYLCPHRLRLLDATPPHLQVNGIEFAGASLLQLDYGAPVEISLEGSGAHYLFRSTLQGQCEVSDGQQRAAVGAGGLSVSSPFASSRIVTGGGCRNAVLSMPREALELHLQHLLGRSLGQPLAFQVPLGAGHPGVHALGLALDYLCRLFALGLDLAPMRQGLADHLVQLLLTQLPHNYSQVLCEAASTPLPSHVRRARDHIEAHLDQPLALSTLCALSGVSVRTLQNGFRQFLGQTPVEYIRDRRLLAVHRALQQGEGSVTEVLLRYGINSPAHFTRQYRQRFGCRPSDTLKR